jgi:ADP-ribose pyrophosphatase YjhB (NUDIX family)
MTAPTQFSHCSSCGRRFPAEVGWPRVCACGAVTYRNPAPVAVLLVPVEDEGLLLVRRAQPPVGLALPSGFIEVGETWRDAAARELSEETGIEVEPAKVTPYDVHSGRDDTLLVFAIVPSVPHEALSGFRPSGEVAALELARGPRSDLVFPLDAEAVARWFGQRGPSPLQLTPRDETNPVCTGGSGEPA